MKDKYFGNINDYHKYGLLRILSNRGEVRTAVCWMRTLDDGRSKGRVPKYLQQRDKYKSLDPELFESLTPCLKPPSRRSIRLARRSGILPFAVQFEALLPHDADKRRKYFRRFLAKARDRDCPLVFLDPDTGLKLMWSPRTGRTSSAHLYLDELQMIFDAGHSVFFYQHFPYKPRDQFVRGLASGLCQLCHVPTVFTFRTPKVVFLLVPQLHLIDYFHRRSQEVAQAWKIRIGLASHQDAVKVLPTRATVDLDLQIHRVLRLKAMRTGMSTSDLINAAVRQSLAEDTEDLAAFEARAKEPNLTFESDLRKRGKLQPPLQALHRQRHRSRR